ncbi:MAG: hypothetical protein HOW73_34355 [Polyangiaceae bacterium]|nr:hypothetical protein [Polyangiaceae bacterium]
MRRGLATVVVGSACWLAAARAADADETDDAAAREPQPVEEVHAASAPSDVRTPEVSTEYFVEHHEGWKVAYHPAARERVREVVPALAQIRDELARALGVPVLAEVELRIATLPIEVDRLVPARTQSVATHGGYSFPDRKLIVMSLGGVETAGEDLETALRHHLAHLAVSEATNGATVPAWFEEGFAMHFAGTRAWGRFADLELATFTGDPPSLVELEERNAAPHVRVDQPAEPSEPTPEDPARRDDMHDGRDRSDALAADFVRFASEERAMPALFDGLRRGLTFDRALEDAFGSDTSEIDRAWRRDATKRYGVFPLAILALLIASCALFIRYLRKRRQKKRTSPRLVLRRTRIQARRRETKLRVPVHVADQELPRVEHDGRWHTLH